MRRKYPEQPVMSVEGILVKNGKILPVKRNSEPK